MEIFNINEITYCGKSDDSIKSLHKKAKPLARVTLYVIL